VGCDCQVLFYIPLFKALFNRMGSAPATKANIKVRGG
jgi:hypothetical protein